MNRKLVIAVLSILLIGILALPLASAQFGGGDAGSNENGDSGTDGEDSDSGLDSDDSDYDGGNADSGDFGSDPSREPDSIDGEGSEDNDGTDASNEDSSNSYDGGDSEDNEESSTEDGFDGDSENNDDEANFDGGNSENNENETDYGGGNSENNEPGFDGGDSENNENETEDPTDPNDDNNNDNDDSGTDEEDSENNGSDDQVSDEKGESGNDDNEDDSSIGDEEEISEEDSRSSSSGGSSGETHYIAPEPDSKIEAEVNPDNIQFGETATVSGTITDGENTNQDVEILLNKRLETTKFTDNEGEFEAEIRPSEAGNNEITVRADGAEKTLSINVRPTVSIDSMYTSLESSAGHSIEVCADIRSQTDATVTLYHNGQEFESRNGRGEVCFRPDLSQGGNSYRAVAVVDGDRDEREISRNSFSNGPRASSMTTGAFATSTSNKIPQLVAIVAGAIGVLMSMMGVRPLKIFSN